jgi:iron(III) transport system permease protein
MASAWVLVFIDALKELPATLILRPTGFDTLPVRIWIEASEEMLELAAPAALMLVVGTLPALWVMMRGERHLSD